MTFFDKFALPATWIVGFGGFAIASMAGKVPGATSELGIIMLFVAIGGLLLFTLSSFELKWVWIDGENLVVSNGWRTETVLLSSIAAVRTWRGTVPARVSVDFKQTTGFGKSIYFLPSFRIALNWGGHPIAAELREAVVREERQIRNSD
jgi:hypothetical protein